MQLEIQAWNQEGQWGWSYRTEIHQQMAQLETRGRRLYLEHGKVLMMKTWATLIFTNRNRASEEVRESSERVDKNSTNQRTLEVKKKRWGQKINPIRDCRKVKENKKINNVNGFSSCEVGALSAFGFRMLEGLSAEGEKTGVQDSGVNCGLWDQTTWVSILSRHVVLCRMFKSLMLPLPLSLKGK